MVPYTAWLEQSRHMALDVRQSVGPSTLQLRPSVAFRDSTPLFEPVFLSELWGVFCSS